MGGASSRCFNCAPKDEQDVSPKSSTWTKESAEKLQQAVDLIFGTREGASSLHNLDFSFSIADPLLDGCPLIGCSTGFTKLCGYELNYIVGRNCRFLVDPVPCAEQDKIMRRHTKDFCEAVRNGQGYSVPTAEREEWMPVGRPNDELFAMQINARYDGTLFNNLFYMKVFNLGTELGKARPYIVALQSELAGGKQDLAKLAENVEHLDQNMYKLQKQLAALFFMQCSMNRQNPTTFARANSGELDEAPKNLDSAFDGTEVEPWPENRFSLVRKLADATRNQGVVMLMHDQNSGEQVAVKQMPNTWMYKNNEEFLRARPKETEFPWVDIGCTRYLNSVDFKYACTLHGVYRSDEHTYVVSTVEPHGDLFCAAERGSPPGEQRETELMPIVLEIFRAVQQLHDLNIAHRDISVENLLESRDETGAVTVRLIDFGMASTGPMFHNSVMESHLIRRPKCTRNISTRPSYQIPSPSASLFSSYFCVITLGCQQSLAAASALSTSSRTTCVLFARFERREAVARRCRSAFRGL